MIFVVHFPPVPAGREFHAPGRFEMSLEDVEVVGEIPPEIDGIFYQSGADRRYPSRVENDIVFNEDGLVQSLRFKDGRVDFNRRYVRTPRFELEREAGEALFGAYRNPSTDDPRAADANRGLANTSALVHNGTLFAMKEDSPPIAMNPQTLETIGSWDFEGGLTSVSFTAHPKKDPETGQLIAFGFGAKGLMTRDVAYYEISPEGKITHEAWFEVPYYCMLHDFGVTRDYVVFPVIPLVGDLDEMRAGKQHYGWDRTKDVFLGVMPRGGGAEDLRWFTAPNQFASHVMNAFNEGTRVSIDLAVSDSVVFPFFPSYDGTPFDPAGARAKLTRWTVDLASTSTRFSEVRTLTDFIGEFPRNDDRFQMDHYRHGWLMELDGQSRNALAHVDLDKGTTTVWRAPDPSTILQEPCFVPLSDTAAEADGFLIQVAGVVSEMRTEILLFDAKEIELGPIATMKLPVRLRPGYHGSWAGADELVPAGAEGAL
ncbi:carotenoid oxygenase family protein [Streptomyces sp. NPDC047081]|uniref:carotenoid oxygenase family protein n=1 Tax=Streptomyces sp. NPDC047081 TaxID=3154706 RepID=UPI0033BFDF24